MWRVYSVPARLRPSQVTAAPQPICVTTATFSHFPGNVLLPHTHPSTRHRFLPPHPSPLVSLLFQNLPHFSLHQFSLPLLSSSSILPILALKPLSAVSHPTSCSHYSPLSLTLPLRFFSLPTPFSCTRLTSQSVGF